MTTDPGRDQTTSELAGQTALITGAALWSRSRPRHNGFGPRRGANCGGSVARPISAIPVTQWARQIDLGRLEVSIRWGDERTSFLPPMYVTMPFVTSPPLAAVAQFRQQRFGRRTLLAPAFAATACCDLRTTWNSMLDISLAGPAVVARRVILDDRAPTAGL